MAFRCWAFIIFSLLVFKQLKAQQNDLSVFKAFEDSCVRYLIELRAATDDEEKKDINSRVISGFKRILSISGSFNYPFDSLKTIGRLYAPDKSFRVITWNLVLNNGDYKYFGFIQTQPSSDLPGKLFELVDRTEEIGNPENSVLSSGKWLGGLYYKILRNKVDDRIYYTLLTLQYHNALLTRKFVEILYFDEWGNPVFGAPVIQFDKKIKHRLVLEYSSSVSVNLRYDEKKKMIIFDHLSPIEPKYTGLYHYYGPDLTFDGLEFKKGKWQYVPNLDLRRPTDPPASKRQPR